MLDAAARVVRAVGVPVTVDAEAGYGLPAAELVERLAAMGAAGFNIEDTDHKAGGLVPADRQAERIAAVRDAARSAGTDLVINARADVYIGGVPDPLAQAVERGRLYLEAGADCIYPIMVQAEDDVAVLAKEIPGPLNTNCFPGGASPARLGSLGVARISFGPMPYLLALDALKGMAGRLLAGEDPYAT
jgi:2-methylisocitrate lyase-like PEP mutase family enzyme